MAPASSYLVYTAFSSTYRFVASSRCRGEDLMTAPTAPPQQREAAATPDVVGWARRAATTVALPIGSVILAFLIGAVIFGASGNDPVLAYQAMACGGFGIACFAGETPALQIANTISFLTPLI